MTVTLRGQILLVSPSVEHYLGHCQVNIMGHIFPVCYSPSSLQLPSFHVTQWHGQRNSDALHERYTHTIEINTDSIKCKRECNSFICLQSMKRFFLIFFCGNDNFKEEITKTIRKINIRMNTFMPMGKQNWNKSGEKHFSIAFFFFIFYTEIIIHNSFNINNYKYKANDK